ncbi:hypothetical protein J3R30DRAFT_3553620 [Lentinula aciculospora]|uniref:Uncharacterized protein n=1 Tax=Lentinula aciculospora TaxID=153920 RepID=A0A9W8ZWG2_9AGAR|nr:hypothetical protein J3R30DRAFT_3553620 [Lentinula aciculospora]
MDTSLKSGPAIGSKNCQIAEIIQYSCELEQSRTAGGPIVRCFPFSRLFKICPGFSAVELTKVLNVDEGGVVELPVAIKQPSGKPWNKVGRYDGSASDNY